MERVLRKFRSFFIFWSKCLHIVIIIRLSIESFTSICLFLPITKRILSLIFFLFFWFLFGFTCLLLNFQHFIIIITGSCSFLILFLLARLAYVIDLFSFKRFYLLFLSCFLFRFALFFIFLCLLVLLLGFLYRS